MAKKDEPPPPPSAPAAPPSSVPADSSGEAPDGPTSSSRSSSSRSRRAKRRGRTPDASGDDKTPPPQILDVNAEDAASGDEPPASSALDGVFEAFLASEEAAVAREFRLEIAEASEVEFIDPRAVLLASPRVRARRARFRWLSLGVMSLAAALCVAAPLVASPGAFSAFHPHEAPEATVIEALAAPPAARPLEPPVDEDAARASSAERAVSTRALLAARLDEAIEAARRATTLNPANAEAWAALASAYDAAGEPEQARAAREACGAHQSAALHGDAAQCFAPVRR